MIFRYTQIHTSSLRLLEKVLIFRPKHFSSLRVVPDWPSGNSLRKCSFFVPNIQFPSLMGVPTGLQDTAWESAHFSSQTHIFRHWRRGSQLTLKVFRLWPQRWNSYSTLFRMLKTEYLLLWDKVMLSFRECAEKNKKDIFDLSSLFKLCHFLFCSADLQSQSRRRPPLAFLRQK